MFKMAQNNSITVRSLGSNAHFNAIHHAITRGFARESARDLKLAKLTTNMAARVRLRKTLLFLSLVSCLQYRSVLPSKTSILEPFQMKKEHSFKPLCWNVNKNCDVDVGK